MEAIAFELEAPAFPSMGAILGIVLLLSPFPSSLKEEGDIYMNWGGHNAPIWVELVLVILN